VSADTGKWFGYQHYGIKPDFVTMAKGVRPATPPFPASPRQKPCSICFKDDPEDPLSYFRDISTLPDVPRDRLRPWKTLRIIEDEKLLATPLAMGERLIGNLRTLQQCHAVIGDVRGIGLFCGAELVRDRATREPWRKRGTGRDRRLQLTRRDHRCHQIAPFRAATIRSASVPRGSPRADEIDRITNATDQALTNIFSFEALADGRARYPSPA